jgi:DNA repair protein RecO (recombination protein O)
MSRVTQEPAYLLHGRAYRETSALLEMLTRDHGRVGLIYKGAKRSQKRWAQLQPFCGLRVSWSGRGELHTLTGMETVGMFRLETVWLKIIGLYLNELIINLVPRGSPSEELYRYYESTLAELSAGAEVESLLRWFEFHLLRLSGYGPQLDFDAANDRAIDPDAYYHYDNERGPILSPPDGVRDTPSFRGRTLLALKTAQLADTTSVRESKQLLRNIIDYQLRGKSLISREIMRYLERSCDKPV